MTEHLKLVKENAYLKLCIINLIEELDKHRELNSIQVFLKDVIEGVEPNTNKKNIEDIFSKLNKGNDK